ncbi:MAG: hypothetical protein LBS60_13480 [Deltaproteobacteria bacterium]|jgi:hypothetical protein|nr:hypothetical protein [Deltaproteobacteria bacterium]
MAEDLQFPVMDTQIFNLGLSVEAISAYILLCSLVGDGKKPDWPILRAAWVGEPAALEPAIRALLLFNVIDLISEAGGEERFWPNPAPFWRMPGSSLD